MQHGKRACSFQLAAIREPLDDSDGFAILAQSFAIKLTAVPMVARLCCLPQRAGGRRPFRTVPFPGCHRVYRP